MDPITPELLMAVAGGTASAAGQQIWTTLRELVTRRSRSGELGGEAELTALTQAANSEQRAHELAEVLALRAGQDPAFAAALDVWRRQAEALEPAPASTGSGDVNNKADGTVHGNLVQARDIHGSVNFGN